MVGQSQGLAPGTEISDVFPKPPISCGMLSLCGIVLQCQLQIAPQLCCEPMILPRQGTENPRSAWTSRHPEINRFSTPPGLDAAAPAGCTLQNLVGPSHQGIFKQISRDINSGKSMGNLWEI